MNSLVHQEQLNAVIQKPMTSIQDPYANLVVPETWNGLQEFADWWLANGMPMKFPQDAEVYFSEDASFVSIFRHGRFQVELYLIHPKPRVPLHEHPEVEVIKLRTISPKGPLMTDILHNGEAHGSGMKLEAEVRGFPLIAIQHWLTREPTTIGAMWRGPTIGPMHEQLIKRYTPDAYVKDGYADTTRKID